MRIVYFLAIDPDFEIILSLKNREGKFAILGKNGSTMGANCNFQEKEGLHFTQDPFPKHNFLDIPEEYSNAGDSFFHILPVPFERSTSFLKGTKNGPAAILRASASVETFDEELEKETFRKGIHTRAPLILPEDPRKALGKIREEVEMILKAEKFPVLLGGEHTLTVGAVPAFLNPFPRLSLLHLDAHADYRDQYEGDPFSHACVMRRIDEFCSFVQVGIRALCTEEWKEIRRERVFPPSAFQGTQDPLPQILSLLSEDVYITLDLDVFDPAFCPGVGTPEPGGLSWFQILHVIREVCDQKRVVGFDVVELLPLRDSHASEVTAAKLIYRMLGYLSGGLPSPCV